MSIFEFLTKFLVFWHPWHPWVCIRSDLKPVWNRYERFLLQWNENFKICFRDLLTFNLSFFRMRMHRRKKKLKFNCLLAKNSCLYLKRFLSWSKLQKCENVPSTFFSRGWLLQWSTMDSHWIRKIWVEIAMSMDSCLVLLRYVDFRESKLKDRLCI